MIDCIPPQSIDAEQGVLGSMMIEREACLKGMEILRAEDFYRPTHQEVFDALAAMIARDEPADMLTLAEELRRRDKLDDTGGVEYLMALVESVPTAANIEHYARIVQRKSELRKLMSAGTQMVGMAQNYDGDDPREIVDAMLPRIRAIGDGRGVGLVKVTEVASEWMRGLQDIENGVVPIKAGFTLSSLNRAFRGGAVPGDLIVIGAGTSQGKSILLNDMIRKACRDDIPTCLFTCEMTNAQYLARTISAQGGIELEAFDPMIEDGQSPDIPFRDISNTLGEVANWDWSLQDRCPSIEELERRISAWADSRRKKQRSGLAVIDYAGLIRRNCRPEAENVETSRIIEKLKGIALDNKIICATASQLRKEIAGQRKARIFDTWRMAMDTVPFPTLDDLIGSSAIQNSADKVVMVFNPNDATLNESGVRPAFLKISKYRNGRSGSKITVFFEAKYTRFVDCDWRYEGGECGDYDSMFHD